MLTKLLNKIMPRSTNFITCDCAMLKPYLGKINAIYADACELLKVSPVKQELPANWDFTLAPDMHFEGYNIGGSVKLVYTKHMSSEKYTNMLKLLTTEPDSHISDVEVSFVTLNNDVIELAVISRSPVFNRVYAHLTQSKLTYNFVILTTFIDRKHLEKCQSKLGNAPVKVYDCRTSLTYKWVVTTDDDAIFVNEETRKAKFHDSPEEALSTVSATHTNDQIQLRKVMIVL